MAVGAEAEEEVAAREVAVPEAGVVQAARRPPQRRRRKRGSRHQGNAPPRHRHWRRGRGSAPRSGRGGSGRRRRPGPPRPPTRSSSTGSGVGSPAASRAVATRQLFSALLPCSRRFSRSRRVRWRNCLTTTSSGSRRGLHPGHVEVVAPPVESLQGGRGIGQGTDRRREVGRADGHRQLAGPAGEGEGLGLDCQTSTTSKRSWCSSGSLWIRMWTPSERSSSSRIARSSCCRARAISGWTRSRSSGGGDPSAQVEQLFAQVEADRGVRLDAAAAAAIGAGLREQALEVGAAALAGDLDQAELGDVEQLGLRPVLLDLALQAGEDLLAVRRSRPCR